MDKIEMKKSMDLSKSASQSVIDSLPSEVVWEYRGHSYRIRNERKVIALLIDDTHLAVIEAPYHRGANKAYIIDGSGNIVWNLLTLSKSTFGIRERGIYFFDVYFVDESLFFFVEANGEESRFAFNHVNGELGPLIQSR